MFSSAVVWSPSFIMPSRAVVEAMVSDRFKTDVSPRRLRYPAARLFKEDPSPPAEREAVRADWEKSSVASWAAFVAEAASSVWRM